MKINELLNKVAGCDLALEILYVNINGISNKHILNCSDLKINKRNKKFKAYSYKFEKVLTFSNDNVKDVKILTLQDMPELTVGKGFSQWTYIFSNDIKSDEDGLYLIACRGDNHLVFELLNLKKNTCFWDFYSGENTHYDGWFIVEPLAFHKIPFLKKETEEWEFFNFDKKMQNECIATHSGIYIRAFVLDNPDKSDSNDNSFLYTKKLFYDIMNLSSGINYDYVICNYGNDLFNDHYFYCEYDFTVEYQNKTVEKKYIAYTCLKEFTDNNHHFFNCLYSALKNASNGEYSEYKLEK